MNSLQQELDNIYKQLEHLEFRKAQLEPIIAEYSDVIERVKTLTDNMIALNIEPTNLRYDIEDILNGDDAGEWVTEADPFKPEATSQPAKDWADEWVEVSTSAHNEDGEVEDISDEELDKLNEFPLPDDLKEAVEAIVIDESQEQPLEDIGTLHTNIPTWDKVAPNVYYHDGLLKVIVPWVNVETSGEIDEICNEICHQAELANSYEFEAWGDNWVVCFSVAGCEGSFDSIISYFFPEPEPTPQPEPVATVKMFAFVPVPTLTPSSTPEPINTRYFPPMTHWENEKSVVLTLSQNRRSKGELQAIALDCIAQGLAESYEVTEWGSDWKVNFSSVTKEETVHQIIGIFYPHYTHTIPTLIPEAKPTPTTEPTPELEKIQLNDRAFRQGDDVLLIGFSNKRLLNTWSKWFKSSWGDSLHVSEISNKLDNFSYCLTVLWYGHPHWERLTGLDYSVKPTEQNKKN